MQLIGAAMNSIPNFYYIVYDMILYRGGNIVFFFFCGETREYSQLILLCVIEVLLIVRSLYMPYQYG